MERVISFLELLFDCIMPLHVGLDHGGSQLLCHE